MALNISHRLARLIRERGYTAGALQGAERQVALLQVKLATAEGEAKQLRQRLGELDAAITAEAPGINPEAVRSVRRTTHNAPRGHGAFMAELVAILKSAPEGVSTPAIVEHMVEIFGLPVDTPERRRRARNCVLRPITKLKSKGAVLRLSNEVSRSGQPAACWRWIGL